ncbi:MAG: class I SAM-dependent methyltransferase [Chloroflexi bacterium]|nr:class I SAM-dependent methyltransferase [Chloroflexota bacterium]
MLNKLLFHRFPTLKSWITRIQYEFISALNPKHDLLFMNFGYTDHHEGGARILLDPQDEIHRYPLQLYHHLAKHIVWNNADALEVSSGRGGGASYIMRKFKPRSYIGVDFSMRAIEFCRTHHQIDGLRFDHGNAEDLKFADSSFDIVLNVEASLYYPNLDKFLAHVKRVLKPGGYFLYADLRYEEKVNEWHKQLKDAGLKLVKEEDITKNVLEALEKDRARRTHLVDTYVPSFLREQFYHFAGLKANTPGGKLHLEHRRYWVFIMQKE